MNWIADNYEHILQWANNITKGDELAEELAHYSIEQFMTHKRFEEIMQKEAANPTGGNARGFLLAIMRNSWIGNKSEFSRYHKLHRADIGSRKRNVESFEPYETADVEYDYEEDRLLEAIEGLMEEMELDQHKLWYCVRLFKMWLEDPNYSSLSRKTDIPRTSISNAVQEAKDYILSELKTRKII